MDERKKELHAKTYDEVIVKLAKRHPLVALKEFEGILAGSPPFGRDKLERME